MSLSKKKLGNKKKRLPYENKVIRVRDVLGNFAIKVFSRIRLKFV